MKPIFAGKTGQWTLATLACLGLLLGQFPAWALGPPGTAPVIPANAPATVEISDVALDDDGRLIGQVVDAQGHPRPGVEVILRQGRRLVGRAITDERGHFVLANIPGGLYSLETGTFRRVFRVWADQTAPPQTGPIAVLVSETRPLVRGHHIESAIDSLDIITLTLVGTSITAVIIAGISMNEIDDLKERLNLHVGSGGPGSP